MEPDLAASLGLTPPNVDIPAGGTTQDPVSSDDSRDFLQEQRDAREEPPAAPLAGRDVAERDRIASLEAEVARLKTASTPDSFQEAQQYLSSQAGEIERQSNAVLTHLLTTDVANGVISEQYARQYVDSLRAGALAQAQAEARERALLPAARQMIAERIATEHSVGNVKITAADLLGEEEVAGMRARAKALQELRRDTAYAARTQKRTDGAEAGGGTRTIDPALLNQLSPGNTIKLGILRGHTG